MQTRAYLLYLTSSLHRIATTIVSILQTPPATTIRKMNHTENDPSAPRIAGCHGGIRLRFCWLWVIGGLVSVPVKPVVKPCTAT